MRQGKQRNQRSKKGKMLLLFSKIGKGCILDIKAERY